MMADVLAFPDRRESFWRAYESGLRDCVRKAGWGDDMADWILNDLKPRVEACDGEFDMDVPTEAAMKVVNFVHDRMLAMIGQMVLLEADLYAAKFLS